MSCFNAFSASGKTQILCFSVPPKRVHWSIHLMAKTSAMTGNRLGKLVGQDAQSVYAKVAELRRRDLVQARSVWRALLPHAIANRLAALALQNIPLATIETQLESAAPERIKKSFSRRLGYLHEDSSARC